MLEQERLELDDRGSAVAALEHLADDGHELGDGDEYAVLAADVPGHDPRVRQHAARDGAGLGGRDLLAGHLGEVLEHRAHHVRAQAGGGGPVGQLAVVEREDLAAGLLDPLDHLELDLQRPDQPVEVRDHDVVGFLRFDHFDGLEQAGALGERALARDIDLGEVGDEPFAALARPALG